MSQASKAAYDIWLTYRKALEENSFSDPTLISICQEEEEEWQNLYLKLSAEEAGAVLMQLGLSTMPDDTNEV